VVDVRGPAYSFLLATSAKNWNPLVVILRGRANRAGGARRAEAAPGGTAPASKYVQYDDAGAAPPGTTSITTGIHRPYSRGLYT
jgi:hypothetical protein